MGKYSLSELVVPDKVDDGELNKILGMYPHCQFCELEKVIKLGMQCKDCIFVVNSNHNHYSKVAIKRQRIGCSQKAFGNILNTTLCCHVGRTDIVYFYYHPELFYRMPVLPVVDFFGFEINQHTCWHKHHYKNPYNDKCVIRATNREHVRFENLAARGNFEFLEILLNTREKHPSLEPGLVMTLKEYELFKKHNPIIKAN